MIESVKKAINRYKMLENARNVTVALSGGADSVSLLLAMLELKDEYGCGVDAAHLNHCLRGEESDGDEQFVRELCERLGVELICERAEIAKISAQSGESVELAARRVRYEFLNRAAKGLIATAHTADDNAETVIYNMTRGTGLNGILGIPPKRDNIVRPLILTERRQIEEYLAEKGEAYRTDSTNNEDIYTRNKIRHGVLPVLRTVNENAVMNISRMTELLRADSDYLKKTADNAFDGCLEEGGLNAERLLCLNAPVRSRVISKLYERQTGRAPERVHIALIEDMLEKNGRRQSVSKNMYAEIKNGVLYFSAPREPLRPFRFEIGDRLPFEANGIRVYTETAENFKKLCRINSLLLKCAVDCDKICGKLVLRSRESGDKIRLNGRNVTKTLKKLFNENKIDLRRRDSVPVAADDRGVLWVGGFGADERAAADEKTKTVLLFDISGGLIGSKG